MKEDCYLTTDELNIIPNNHERNIVFWWYATNVYSIVGKGNTKRISICLEYAIREKYPNPDVVPYKGYWKRKH